MVLQGNSCAPPVLVILYYLSPMLLSFSFYRGLCTVQVTVGIQSELLQKNFNSAV